MGLCVVLCQWGVVLCQWLVILHHQVSTFFMLHSLLPDLPVEFSIRPKEPAVAVFFTIY
jgi:hypothetical protein